MKESTHQSPPLAEASPMHTLLEETRQHLEILRLKNKSREYMLSYLASVAERVSGPNTAASVLVLDKEGLLRNGGSPRLPVDYLKAIDGLKPSPDLGTCCAAAATGEIVLTPDFLSDEKWSELKHLPRSIGYAGAWSVPIKGSDGKVLGTFGTYFSETRTPSPSEEFVNTQLALLAADVIEATTA